MMEEMGWIMAGGLAVGMMAILIGIYMTKEAQPIDRFWDAAGEFMFCAGGVLSLLFFTVLLASFIYRAQAC